MSIEMALRVGQVADDYDFGTDSGGENECRQVSETEVQQVDPCHGAQGRAAATRFGTFEVLPRARTLLRNGSLVEIGSRAFDLLLTLLNARGEVVSKEAIIRHVWPTTIVDEGNLRVQLSCLRRALGTESWRIKTIPGRGYLLAADRYAGHGPEAPQHLTMPKIDSTLIVVIEMDPESREALLKTLANAGGRLETFASLAALSEADDRQRSLL